MKSYWLALVTRLEIELYLAFLKGLTEVERKVYILADLHGQSGELAPFIGANDVRDVFIDAGGGPCRCPTSDTVDAFVKKIEERWKDVLEQHGFSRIHLVAKFGFQALVTDILFQNGGDLIRGRREAQLVGVLIHIEKFEARIHDWLEFHRPTPATLKRRPELEFMSLWNRIIKYLHENPRQHKWFQTLMSQKAAESFEIKV